MISSSGLALKFIESPRAPDHCARTLMSCLTSLRSARAEPCTTQYLDVVRVCVYAQDGLKQCLCSAGVVQGGYAIESNRSQCGPVGDPEVGGNKRTTMIPADGVKCRLNAFVSANRCRKAGGHERVGGKTPDE